MPGNEVGDRVHNFFAQDNLSQGPHSQVVGGSWPSVNNLWVGSQKQVGAPNSNPKFYNPQQSEIERVSVPHGFNFMQTTARSEFANNQSQSQQQNSNGYMYGRHALQTRPDEANFLGLDTYSDQNNVNQRDFLAYESQQEVVSEQILRNSDGSNAFDAHGSLDLFGGPHQMQPVQQQRSGFNDIQHLQHQLMLRKMQELQRQKDSRQLDTQQQNSVNQASPFARQSSGSQSHGLINGTPTSESAWAELTTGNTNWLQRGAPALQGSSSGLVFSPEQGQMQRSTGFAHQQVDQSLYGVPVSSARAPPTPYNYVSGNSFAGNQYGIPEQTIIQDGMSVNRQGLPGKSLFGHTSGQGLNSGINAMQPRDLIGPSEIVHDKPAIEAASLDPDEEKILFGSDENIWVAFGSDGNMGGAASSLLDDNEFVSGVPSLQSGSWSALMQSAVAETSSGGLGLQEEWTGLNVQNLEQQTPLADVHLPNATAMSSGNSQPNNKQNDWNPIDSVPPRDNLLQQFQSNNCKRVMHDEIGRVNALPNPNVDPEPVNTSIRGNHFGQFPSSNHQLNYWKHVQSSVNLSKSQLHPNKGSQVSESSLNSSDKEDMKMHEIESRRRRENSHDSYQSSSSHQTTSFRLRENSSDAGDLRPLPLPWTKQSLLNQAGRKTAGVRKFQYHPMGNLDEDVEVPYEARQGTNTQAMSLQHFQGLRGQNQIGGQVPISSSEMGKGHVHDLEGITKGSHDMRSKGMIGVNASNMFAPFDKAVGLSTSEKASQPSQNMLELLHKVDRSRDRGTVRHVNSSDHHISSEMPEPEYSDGSFGGMQRSHSSNSQGFGLQLGPPSQRLPLPNNALPSGVQMVNSNSLSQTHASNNPRDKGQAVLPSLPPFSETSHGEFKNRIGGSKQNASEIATRKTMSNLSSPLGAGFPSSRSQLQNRQMIGARGPDLRNNSDNQSKMLPNVSIDHPTQQQLVATQALPLNVMESTSLCPQNLDNQETEKRGKYPAPNVFSGKADQGQMTNGPLGKETDTLSMNPAATQRDLEAFGRSLKPNNFHHNYSLMKATKTTDNDPCNRATKRLKGMDELNNLHSKDMHGPAQHASQGLVPTKPEYSHISPLMAPSWFDQYGTFKNSQLPEKVDTVRSIEQPFSAGRLPGGLEIHNSKEQAGPASPSLALERSSDPLPTTVGVQNLVTLVQKKRRLATADLHPWLVEVSGSSENLQGICTGAEEWSRAANRLMEKVHDDGEVIEDVLPVPRPKRRLILTTLLMQQLLRPPPSVILSTAASSSYESVVYHTVRLVLGDACNLVSLATSISHSEANLQSNKSKSSEGTGDGHLSKVMQDFMSKAGKLEDEFLRLDKKTSILDLRVEFQDLERFAVINRFARFHGRAQIDVAESSSSDTAANAPKPFPQRYVTAAALPTNLPDTVQCLSL